MKTDYSSSALLIVAHGVDREPGLKPHSLASSRVRFTFRQVALIDPFALRLRAGSQSPSSAR